MKKIRLKKTDKERSSDVSFGFNLFLSAVLHVAVLLMVMGLSTMTFGSGKVLPTVYSVELVSLPQEKGMNIPAPAESIKEEREKEEALFKFEEPPAEKVKEAGPVLLKREDEMIYLRKEIEKEIEKLTPKEVVPEAVKIEEEEAPPPPRKVVAKKPSPVKKVEKKRAKPSLEEEVAKYVEDKKRKKEFEKIVARFKGSRGQVPERGGTAEGGSIWGRVVTDPINKARLRDYLKKIDRHIKYNWRYPSKAEEIFNRVLVRFDRKGAILLCKVLKSSGNRLFDDSTLRAIKKAEPLPPLPGWYPYNDLEVEIIFNSLELR